MRSTVAHVHAAQSDLFLFQDGDTALFQDGSEVILNGKVWVDLSADLSAKRVTHTRGLKEASATRKIAGRGSASFSLDNLTNSAGLQGYYSPLHANVMLGWGKNNRVRIGYQDDSYSSDIEWRWQGWISKITPAPGKFRDNEVDVRCVDYIEILQDRQGAKLLTLLKDVTDDVAYQDIIDAQPVQPMGTNFSTGIDNLEYVFHRTGEKSGTGFEEMRRIAQSTFSYIYIDKDGNMASQNRLDRAYENTPAFVISDTDDYFMQVSYSDNRKSGVDKITSTTYPVAAGASEETAFELENPIRLNPGDSYTLVAEYKDPASNKPVGLENPVTFVAGTHYKFGSVNNGTHNNLVDDLGITPTFYGSAAEIVMTNNGNRPGYVNYLLVEGNILRTDDPVESSLVIDASGSREIKLDMPYQTSEAFAESARYMVKYVYEDAKQVGSVKYNVNDSDMLANFFGADIGNRISVTETVTGLSSYEAYINAETVDYNPSGIVNVTYHLAEASTDTKFQWDVSLWDTAYWVFGEG